MPLFLINCHREIEQTVLLCRLLNRHFGGESIVHLDGESYTNDEMNALDEAGPDILIGDYQPDKCRGTLTAVNALVRHAMGAGYDVATFLHPDMIPLDRAALQSFTRRFLHSGKALSWAPLRPHSPWLSFCALNFRLALCEKLFPLTIGDEREARLKGEWYNEIQLTQAFDRAWTRWRENAYLLTLMNWPHSTAPDGGIWPKVAHSPSGVFVYHDFCPETSVVHSNDKEFWSQYGVYHRS